MIYKIIGLLLMLPFLQVFLGSLFKKELTAEGWDFKTINIIVFIAILLLYFFGLGIYFLFK